MTTPGPTNLSPSRVGTRVRRRCLRGGTTTMRWRSVLAAVVQELGGDAFVVRDGDRSILDGGRGDPVWQVFGV